MTDTSNHPIAFRSSDETRRQLAWLRRHWSENQTQTITRAIERAYTQLQEQSTMRSLNPSVGTFRDHTTGDTFDAEILDAVDIDDTTEFGHFVEPATGNAVAYVRYHMSGITFVPVDWQGRQPSTVDDIPSVAWCTDDGRDAILLNGLPVIIE